MDGQSLGERYESTSRPPFDSMFKDKVFSFRSSFPTDFLKGQKILIYVSSSDFQVLTTLSYIKVVWTDPDLAWDSTEAGSPGEGIEVIGMTAKDIWVPRLMLLNRVASDKSRVRQVFTLMPIILFMLLLGYPTQNTMDGSW